MQPSNLARKKLGYKVISRILATNIMSSLSTIFITALINLVPTNYSDEMESKVAYINMIREPISRFESFY